MSQWVDLVSRYPTLCSTLCTLPNIDGLIIAYGIPVMISIRLLFTGLCTRTKLLKDAQDKITVLNRATAIKPNSWGTINALIISTFRLAILWTLFKQPFGQIPSAVGRGVIFLANSHPSRR